MDTKDWLDFLLGLWQAAIATIALVHQLKKDKTAPSEHDEHEGTDD